MLILSYFPKFSSEVQMPYSDCFSLKLENNRAVGVEVKRQKKKIKPELLATKVKHLKNKLLPEYTVKIKCLPLEDM